MTVDRVLVAQAELHLETGCPADAFFELEQVSIGRLRDTRECLSRAQEFVRLALDSPHRSDFSTAAVPPAVTVRQPTAVEKEIVKQDYELVIKACQRGKTVSDISTQMGYPSLYVKALLAACPP